MSCGSCGPRLRQTNNSSSGRIKSSELWHKSASKSCDQRCGRFSRGRFRTIDPKVTVRPSRASSLSMHNLGRRRETQSIKKRRCSICAHTIARQRYLFFAQKYYTSVPHCFRSVNVMFSFRYFVPYFSSNLSKCNLRVVY